MRMNSSGTPHDIVILRAGILDDIEILNEYKPKAEIYIDGRVSWISTIEGADQLTDMPPLP